MNENNVVFTLHFCLVETNLVYPIGAPEKGTNLFENYSEDIATYIWRLQ